MISVNSPITIEGRSCILMRDVLGGAASDKYTSQEQGNLKVWYEEQSLRDTRDAHPKTPIYGFWQTLIASRLIDTSIPLQYIFTSESKDFGYYLYSHDNQLHTGSLFQNELQRLPGVAIQEGITIADGKEITVSMEDLKLPVTPLLTHKERVAAAVTLKKKAQQQGMLAVAMVGGLALLADTGLAHHHKSHMKDFNRVSTELHIAEQALVSVNRQKLENWPLQSKALASLYQVSNAFSDSSISGEINLLPTKSIAIEVNDSRDNRAKLAILADMGIESKRLSANTTIIQWVNDASH
ncbi:hypothetical protein [Methylophaga sp.]|uniref:hypothetical protein n=1 Tax=Methylophaga sp. TaxID=2024840 RepID=UPI00271F03F2|nr:hypothetical protein [Methylophaga sp.]MDO8827975.1 hypothetical protein [Methylophaga sp.]